MLKLLFTSLIMFFGVSAALAQDDHHKFEVSGGYSFERAKGFPGDESRKHTEQNFRIGFGIVFH